MPNITWTGDTVFKQKLFNVISKNEVGGPNAAAAYQISFADRKSNSGWSFGWLQYDLSFGRRVDTFKSILQDAKDANGNFIIDDGDPNTDRLHDNTVIALVGKAKQRDMNSLSAADQLLINSALSSAVGHTAIDGAVDADLQDLMLRAQQVANLPLVSTADQVFLQSDLGRLFLCDYHNQYNIDPGGALEKFVQGLPADGLGHGTVVKQGDLGVDDLLNFYFRTTYAFKKPYNPVQRFANVLIETNFTFSPADSAQAKQAVQAYTLLIAPYKALISQQQGTALTVLMTQVFNPARDKLILDFVTNNAAISNKPTINGEVLVGDDHSNNDVDFDSVARTSGALRLLGGNQNDLIFGEGGNDTLDGGAGDNVLYGGTGRDTLKVASGNSYLSGGAEADIYEISGTGIAHLIDSAAELQNDRVFFVSPNGTRTEATGKFIRTGTSNVWTSPDGLRVITHDSPYTITDNVTGEQIVIESFEDGDFGIDLMEAPTPITPTREINGDLQPIDFDPPNQNYHTDDLGNLVVDPNTPAPGRHDQLRDSAGSDHIVSGGGSDLIDLDAANLGAGGPGSNGRGGDDWIQTGDGRDGVFSGSGNDLIEGGTGGTQGQRGDGIVVTTTLGGDVLHGGAGDDRIFGDSQIDLAAAISAGNTQTATGNKGDWLSGQAGDDILVAGADNDVLAGGSGADLLIGGAGDDNLIGDANWVAQSFDWFYHDEPPGPGERTGSRVFEPFSGETNPVDSGADTIYAGAGTDWVRGGGGDDVIYGEGGNDDIAGEWGNDELFGGAGNDFIAGDAVYITNDADHGDDYLDGGDGNDTLQGNGGADVLFGGIGDDVLYGDDSYVSAAFQGADYLDGEDGADHLEGAGGDDVLIGGAGADELLGGAGNDEIDGGTENDTAFGEAGNDYLDGGDGDDFLNAGDGDDTLIGGAGADVLTGGAGNDTIVANLADGDFVIDGIGANTLQVDYGGDVSALAISQVLDSNGLSYLALADAGGNQVFVQGGFAGAVSDFDFGGPVVFTRGDLMRQAQVASLILTGTAADENFIGGNNADQISAAGGNDVIEALGGNDTLDGGTGADTLQGGAGDDTYVVDNAGDVVIENAGEGIDLVQSSVSYTLSAEVENITLTGAAAIDATGNALNNVLTGNAAANTLDGAAGNDTLAGGFAADTYLFGRGSGQDVIQESDDGTNALDKVQFAVDVAPADVAVTRTTNDLVLTITATGDKLTVANYFVTPTAVVEQFRFNDGTVWNDATIAQKLSTGTPGNDIITGTAGNDVLNGLAGNDTISGQNGDDRLFGEAGLDTLNGNNGADLVDGGVDPDTLFGGNGGDTYIFARGYGNDLIIETDDGTNPVDQVQFAADILPADVTARRNGRNLELTVNGTSDKVTISSYFNNDGVGSQVVEQLHFGDGTIWNVATVKALVLVPTAGADTLTGYATDDVINGGAGNDTIDGAGGNDTLLGDAGADILTGGAGDDTFRGGTENDSLSGGLGNDTYFYDLGDGNDNIF